MSPYLILLIASLVIAYLGRRSGIKLVRRASIGVVMLALVAFAGLRSYSVGTDTITYVSQFAGADSFYFVNEGKTEIGYNLLVRLARSISDSYSILLLMIALVVVYCYLSTIVKLVKRYETAVSLFVTLGVYTSFFNGARQGIAAAICFWALPLLLQRRALPYFAAIGVATLFHKTALVALPIYFLAAPRIGTVRLATLASATVFLVVFLRVFVGLVADFIDDKFAVYGQAGEGGGSVLLAFLVGQGALLYWLKNAIQVDRRDLYYRLLNIYMVGVVIAIVSVMSSVNPSGLLRLHQYFSSMAILMWPMVFSEFSNTSARGLVGYAFLLVTLLYFVLTTNAFGNLVPYMINPELVFW